MTGKKEDFKKAQKYAKDGNQIFIKFSPNPQGNINPAQFFKTSKNGLKGMNEDSSDSESQNSYSNISS